MYAGTRRKAFSFHRQDLEGAIFPWGVTAGAGCFSHGYNWYQAYVGRSGADDDIAFVSDSYYYSALNPDNWLITPIINLGGTMSVWMKSYSPYYLDTFAIYLTTDLDFDEVEDFNIPLVVKSVAPDEWTEYTADLSAYAGQQGYIAIRHFNSYDRYALLMDDFRVDGEGIMLSNVSSPVELPGLIPEAQNQVQVQAICTSGVSEWSDPVEFTTHGLCDVLSSLSVTPSATTASLEWTGYQDQYTVRYQTLESYNSYLASGMATVTLTIGDVWGDGSGYQMLLDADATAYGDIIPETGGLTTGGDASEAVYAEFEYKIPANADGLLNTSNIVLNNSVTISIPAGIYDFCITNPTPGDRMWIASSNGTVNGREDDYVFEAGKTYEFEVTPHGSNDGVDVTITSNIPEDSWTKVTNVSNPAEITGLNPETTYFVQVQGICGTGVTAWTELVEFTTTAASDEPEPIEPGECGIATDCDGHDYPTVKIGDVCWMTKNLAVESCVTSGNVYAYVNAQFPNEAANVATYGLLYDEEAVMQGSGAKATASPGICPTGYRLPTVAEIEALGAAYSADELKSTDYWITGGAGSDLSGFSWLPGGCYSSSKDNFESMLLEGYLWATEKVGGVVSPAMYKITYYCSTILMRVEDHTGLSASVRCVKKSEPETFTCGTSKMKDANDNEYETMLIGTQCWTKTNLRATKDRNGNDFINGVSAAAGSFDAYADAVIYIPTVEKWNEYNSSVTYNNNTFGYYYNWTAANNVCPVGWHLPSDEEWTTMEQTQTSMDVTGSGLRGDHAGKLAGGEGWNPSTTAGAPGNASDPDHNASGFSAVPAGGCDGSSFYNAGYSAYFWSATQSASYPSNAYARHLAYDYAGVRRPTNFKDGGYSVRCLRD